MDIIATITRLEAETIMSKIEGHCFKYHALKTNYDPMGIVDKFYQNFHSSYKHYSLSSIQRYKNIHSMLKIQNICKQLSQEERDKKKKVAKDKIHENLLEPREINKTNE